MIKVAVAGGFDPCHEGHIDHIDKASRLGDWLIIIVQPDEAMVKKKGYCYIPLYARAIILRGLLALTGGHGEVIRAIDKDGTVAETLRLIKPDIFAKGGDRTPFNMPENELKACEDIGCEIKYGIGDLLNSSSKVEEWITSKTPV